MSHLMTTADLPPMARPNLGTVFLAAARSEWTKLRTVRSTVRVLIFTVLTIVGIGPLLTALEVSRWNQRSLTEITGFDPIVFSFAGLNLAQLSIVVLGVLVMTSEYATGGIKLTFGATPQRTLLLAAKVATFCAIVTIVTIVTVVSRLAAFLISQGLLAPKQAGLSIGDPGVHRAVIGGGVHLVLIGAVAAGVGAALRRTAAAVAVLFAVLLVIPGLVLLFPLPWNDHVTQYLPSSAGVATSAVMQFPNLLTPSGGALVLCGYAGLTPWAPRLSSVDAMPDDPAAG